MTQPMSLYYDETTARLIALARETQDRRPPEPDPDVHTGTYLETVARKYDDWDRHMGALRLLIGVRLTSAVLGD